MIEGDDPKVHWRLAELAQATAGSTDAEKFMEAARAGIEVLPASHPLAFDDHAAEFYFADGGNPARAFELARLNLARRYRPNGARNKFSS